MMTSLDLPPLPPLEACRQLLPTIHGLRQRFPGHDRAILDLFHLLELGLAPGAVSTAGLLALWRCSQPQVSRRVNAIDGLGVLRVQSGSGAYVLTDRATAAWTTPRDIHAQMQTARRPGAGRRADRWDAARARLAALGVVA